MSSPSLALLSPYRHTPALCCPFSRRAFASAQGAATEEHPVTEELARIKTYMGKLKQLGEGASQDQQRLKVFLRSSHCLPVSPLFHPFQHPHCYCILSPKTWKALYVPLTKACYELSFECVLCICVRTLTHNHTHPHLSTHTHNAHPQPHPPTPIHTHAHNKTIGEQGSSTTLYQRGSRGWGRPKGRQEA